MASFSIKSFDKKLKEMSARQDSVQTVSLWLIHHRAHSKSVVSAWLDRVKKAKPDRRLVLFYLANDVIQNSRKKGKEFSSSFGKILEESMQYLRDTSIRPAIERVLKIWLERKVFDKDAVQKLLDGLNNVSVKAKPKIKAKPEVMVPSKKKNDKVAKPVNLKEKKAKHPIPSNFKTVNVTRAIGTMQGIEDETERRQTLVSQMKLDASSSDGIKQLKDYAGGNRFSIEFEESSKKYKDLVESLESESEHRQALINILEDGEAYYYAALKEATIIANAYRSFGNRLHSMKKKLDNKIRKYATAEKEAPVSAPKASFLGSGLSGILEQVSDSPSGSDQGRNVNNKDETVDTTIDHVEVADMDLDSDSENDSKTPEESVTPENNLNSSGVTSAMDGSSTATTDAQNLTTNALSEDKGSSVDVVKPPAKFGYTMTAASNEDFNNASPGSHVSAPSPEGSPDLNLDVYEEDSGQGLVANKSFDGSQVHSHLTSNENAGDGISGDVYIQEEDNKPLLNLLGNLLLPLATAQQEGQQGESQEYEDGRFMNSQYIMMDQGGVTEGGVSKEAKGRLDSGMGTDEDGIMHDGMQEEGIRFGHTSSALIQHDTSFPHPRVPPISHIDPLFHTHRPIGERPQFMPPEKIPRFPSEAGVFRHDGVRRPSFEEDQPHLRSPSFGPTRLQGRAAEWNHGPPFGPRGMRHPLRESRDPRLRRREMLGKQGVQPPFVDHGLGELHRATNFEREDILRRRLSVGDEREIPLPELHESNRRGLPLPFERHPIDMRENFPIIERDLPHHLRDRVIHDRRNDYDNAAMHDLRNTHQLERQVGRPDEHLPYGVRSSMDHPELHQSEYEESRAIDHSFEHVQTSQKTMDNSYLGHGVAHDALRNTSDTPSLNASHVDDRGHIGDYPPEQPLTELEKFERQGYQDEINYDEAEVEAFDQDVMLGDMRRQDEHSFEIHPDEQHHRFAPRGHPRMGRPFGGSHFGHRLSRPDGPRNFHANLEPLDFRPPHDNGLPRPHFHPGGTRLKRPGPPFNGNHMKRPHF